MYQLTILYGHPDDAEEFDRYYYEEHIPIARRMKGLTGWTIGKLEAMSPGEKPPYYMVVSLFADTREDLEKILDSPEGRAAADDVPNFATGGATFMFDEEEVLIRVEQEVTNR